MLAARSRCRDWPSGEMVAPVIECFELDEPGRFPLNIPNARPVADLPDGSPVESICVADGKGLRGRDEVRLPPAMAECLRRVSASQELTVEAAVTGNRDKVVEAMLLDPLAGRIDYDQLGADDRRDARGDESVAPAVRVRLMTARPRSTRSTSASSTTPAALGERSGAARGDASLPRDRRSRRSRTPCSPPATRSSTSSPRSCSTARRRLVARGRLPHGRVRRHLRRPSRELPALHARTARRAAAVCGVPLPRRRRHRPGGRGARYAALLREHPLDLCCLGHRRERAPCVQRPARRRLRRPARREGRRARRASPSAAGGRRPLPDVDDVPTHAITVTIPALLARVDASSRSCPRRARPSRCGATLAGPISTACPASILRTPTARHALPRRRVRRARGLTEPGRGYFFDGTDGRFPVR